MLSRLHPHPRDSHIHFFEEEHKYEIDDPSDTSNEKYTSVTTFIHSLFKPFDADIIIDKMMKSPKWPSSPYYGMTALEIKSKWEEKRDAAASAGTKMHLSIENYYNQVPNEPSLEESVEFKYFKAFQEEVIEKNEWIPYRTEWTVYDIETKLAGSIDIIYQVNRNNDTELVIYDWKRAENIKKEGFDSGKSPIDHLPDTNFWHYALQLNIYKYILEKNYGKRITQLCLVVLHPSNNGYKLFEVPALPDEITDVMNFRMSCL